MTTIVRPLACFLCIVALIATAGCGSKKKGKGSGPTIQQRLDAARKEAAVDRKASALIKVARSQFKLGDKTGAAGVAKEAFKALVPDGKAVPADADPNIYAPKLVEVGSMLAEVGEKGSAKTALKAAMEMADKIGDAVRKAGVLADTGGIYADKAKGLGDSKMAKEALDKAKEVAMEMEDRFKGDALKAVALGYVKGGLNDAAAEMVELLEETGRSLEDARAKAEALAAAANVRLQTGKKDLAKELLDEAAKAAKGIDRTESRAYALLAVGQATVAAGEKKGGMDLLDQAYKAADKVGDPEARQTVLNKVSASIDELKKK